MKTWLGLKQSGGWAAAVGGGNSFVAGAEVDDNVGMEEIDANVGLAEGKWGNEWLVRGSTRYAEGCAAGLKMG